jgi:hypothetical protein
VGSRYATGLTVANFPLTAALLAVTAASYQLAAFMGSLFLIVVLLTVAPKVKYSHKLPVFGVVRFAVNFRVNGAACVEGDGQEEVVLAVPRGSLPSTVLIEMAVRNLTNREIENVQFSLGADVGHGMRICDGWGRSVSKGDLLPPGGGFDLASLIGRHVTAREAPLFHLRMRIREIGRYRAYITINAASFYRSEGALLEFDVIETDTPGLRDRLAPVIDRAESISNERSDAFGGEDGMRRALMAVTLEAHQLLLHTESQEFVDRFSNAEPDYSGVKNGDEYLRATALAKAKVLYELRSELGRREANSHR